MTEMETVRNLLDQIYGRTEASFAFERILGLIERFPKVAGTKKRRGLFSEIDALLITYADSLKNNGEIPLQTLHRFARKYFKGVFSAIHLLPFFPYSSDDGFSVTDFFAVNPGLGSWEDVETLGRDFQLMFDMVLNHVSAESEWFNKFLNDVAGYESLAVAVDPASDLSMATRPRALPLLTLFKKKSGEAVHVWTTFSPDQIDLNYKSPDILIKMVSVLLHYVERGARFLRFDAVAYLWKEIGTNCIHLPQTHAMVKLFRAVLDVVAPEVSIITETNVPHSENISYFGNGSDEAQLIYNFTLPPLLLHAFLSQDARVFSRWAADLELPSSGTTFLNFTASHDGIGVRPLEGILPEEEILKLAKLSKTYGAGASIKRNPDGSDSPYELNITYLDALLSGGVEKGPPPAGKFLASQAIQYVLPGVPATYIHSVLGSRNWNEGVRQTGRARTINRRTLSAWKVSSKLKDPETFRSRIFHPYIHLIKVRKRQPAFNPDAKMNVLDIHPRVFAVVRACERQTICALTNVSSGEVSLSPADTGLPLETMDLLTGNRVNTNSLKLAPYEFVWLTSPESIT